MGAAAWALQQAANMFFKSLSDCQAFQLFVRRCNVRAFVEWGVLCYGLCAVDKETAVDSQAYRHAVEWLSGFDCASVAIGKVIGLCVVQAGLDIPKAILAQVSQAFDTTRMDQGP
ncbi:hypothetical protein AY555_01675 [Haematospirillum jordaniae]|uniref:Uncharacterized protein n=1 Tax=Haematospirillum jordaniae TaxID=1549855 RepID=A0A143DBK5_9PROT|nr:hypothetical protein AY555_01675 [Haematospirillum jordaniae]